MLTRLSTIGALTGAFLLTAVAGANALPAPKLDIAKSDGVTLVARGQGGGARSFSGGRSFSAGKTFSGARTFSGPRTFSGGAVRSHKGFSGGGYVAKHPGHKHRGSRGVYFYSVPYYTVPYAYGTYVDDDCAWLYRKARRTGSAYWWNRYRECRDD